MDDFRIYDRALTSIEASDLYGNGNGDFGVHTFQDFLHLSTTLGKLFLL